MLARGMTIAHHGKIRRRPTVQAIRPSGPIVVGPARHRDVLISGLGVPAKVPDSCRGARAA
jgi:hypothetical protein